MNDKSCNCLRQLRSSFHDPQAKRNDLSLKQEIDDLWVIDLDEGTDHSKRGQPQILEASSFGDRVEERIEKQRNVSLQKELSGVFVGGNTLK